MSRRMATPSNFLVALLVCVWSCCVLYFVLISSPSNQGREIHSLGETTTSLIKGTVNVLNWDTVCLLTACLSFSCNTLSLHGRQRASWGREFECHNT